MAHPCHRGKLNRGKQVVFIGGNAQILQHYLHEHGKLARALETNLITFNYRGCGLSEGCPRVANDLVVDGAAVLDHLVSIKGVDPSNILIFGMSLGAAVGAYVRTLPRFQGGPICCDRSFCDVRTGFSPALLVVAQ
jgi:pimeloyl-ACP methyl ester carboxylesterase